MPPGVIQPGAGGDHYKVFTPYYRRWCADPLRPPCEPAPERIIVPAGWMPAGSPVASPAPVEVGVGPGSPARSRGGESGSAAGARSSGPESGLRGYGEHHDDLPGGRHLAPVAVPALRVPLTAGGAPARESPPGGRCRHVRPAAVLARLSSTRSSPPVPTPRGPTTSTPRHRSTDDPDAVAAWTAGRTGYPVVDAV